MKHILIVIVNQPVTSKHCSLPKALKANFLTWAAIANTLKKFFTTSIILAPGTLLLGCKPQNCTPFPKDPVDTRFWGVFQKNRILINKKLVLVHTI